MTPVVFRRLGAPHLGALLDHLERAAPRGGAGVDRREMRARYAECLAGGSRIRCWTVVWGAWAGPAIVGHAEVRGDANGDSPHRGRLDWGVEPGVDHREVGRHLVEAAVAWSIANPDLDWLDAHVTDDDSDRLAVVRVNGFTIVGRVPDRFRIGGRSVGDVLVARRVAAWRGRETGRTERVDRTERHVPTAGGVLLRSH